jgi:hypothetical protein
VTTTKDVKLSILKETLETHAISRSPAFGALLQILELATVLRRAQGHGGLFIFLVSRTIGFEGFCMISDENLLGKDT